MISGVAVITLVAWAGGLLLAPQPALAQEIPFGETATPDIIVGQVGLDEAGRKAWGLSETDWTAYRELMAGPSGLWYPHLAPAMVLGINASSEAERRRFARIVWDQERRRLDALFAFNRSYQEIARAERDRPGFSLFHEPLLRSPARTTDRADGPPERMIAFVGGGCPRCDSAIRTLATSGRALDVYYVGAESDSEIRSFARQAGIPVERVLDRTITLNHDSHDLLARSGYREVDLPLFFMETDLQTPVRLQTILGGADD